MKATVEIPDDVYAQAERLAHRRQQSAGDVLSTAVRQYLREQDDEDVTARLNQVYGRRDAKVTPALTRAQTASIPPEDW